jgi:regulator of protease activity HflC (stomatin/prohibitin superfamily)
MNRSLIVLIAIVAVAVVAALNTNGFIVKTGNIGLVINDYTGKIDPNIRHAGFNAQPPFSGNELLEIPTYERTYTMVKDSSEGAHQGDDSVMVNTLNANTLNVDTSITYHIAWDPQHPERIIELYKKYRNQFADFGQFEESQLRPAFRQAIVDAFGAQTTSENMTGDGKRKDAAYALSELNQRFNADSIVIDEVRVRAIYPDSTTVAVLRSRLQAQQNVRLAQLNLQLVQLQNQKQVMDATAQAQAARIRAASLTPRLVRYRHIKNLDIIGVPKGAIIDIPSEQSSDSSN